MLVAIEGCDGSGKSWLVSELASAQIANSQCVLIRPKRCHASQPFVQRRLSALAALLWQSDEDTDTRHLLPDEHWVCLSASYFHLVDRFVVRPAIRAHDLVVLDSWIDKMLARFALKGRSTRERTIAAYSGVTQPDLVVLLDITPSVAADRKVEFGPSECGVFDGLDGVSRLNFEIYQGRVRQELLTRAAVGSWRVIQVDAMTPTDVLAQTVSTIAAAQRASR
jgi:thymidylate kinase